MPGRGPSAAVLFRRPMQARQLRSGVPGPRVSHLSPSPPSLGVLASAWEGLGSMLGNVARVTASPTVPKLTVCRLKPRF